MKKLEAPLNILLVEDSAADAEEILYLLRKADFKPDWLRVDTAVDMKAALTDKNWDIIVCDHFIPGFGSGQAFRLLKDYELDIPFIIVSGVVDEDAAIDAIKAGACNFIKKDRLSRLAPAIKRELTERRHRLERDVARKGLAESEERLRLMVDTALDYAIFMLDAAGLIITWNIGAERIFGYEAHEAIGMPLAMLFPDSNQSNGETPAMALATAAATGRFEEEAYRKRKNGTIFWAHGIMLAIKNPDGSIKGYSRITRDIDEMKRASQALLQVRREKAEVDVERQNLRILFEQTSAIVAILTGPEHRIEFSNPSFVKFTGRDAMGEALRDVLPASHELHALADSAYLTGVGGELKEVSAQFDGETHFFDFVLSKRCKRLGEVDGIMIFATEVTEQLLARKAAEASSASKSTFLANMSHEIRTPLGAILGFSTLLREQNLSPTDRDQFIETINRNGQALTRIIDDILDLAKVEAGRLEIEEINFSIFDLMTEVIDFFREKAKEKGIYLLLTIGEEVPPFICSDPTRLRQVLFNIIGNAIKFTEVGGVRVLLGVKSSSEGALRMAIEVKDTGCGLSEMQQRRLFQPFTQADNATTRQFGGTGLGLALSRRLCEVLGGSISIVSSEVANGSVFCITFVASTARGRPSTKQSKPVKLFDSNRYPLQDVTVLVVDDAPDNLMLVKRFLTRSGAAVDIAEDGRQGLEQALAGSYDVVLMDIQMPVMDGYEAMRELRAHGYYKPIIALTAHAMLEEKIKTRSAGFDGHLTKPLAPEELVETVATHAIKARENLQAASNPSGKSRHLEH